MRCDAMRCRPRKIATLLETSGDRPLQQEQLATVPNKPMTDPGSLSTGKLHLYVRLAKGGEGEGKKELNSPTNEPGNPALLVMKQASK